MLLCLVERRFGELKWRKPNQNIQALLIDDAEFLDGARRALLSHGIWKIATLQDSAEVLKTLADENYSVLLLDLVMPDPSGALLLPDVVRRYPFMPVVIMSGVRDLDNVVHGIKQGAYDYITKQLDTTRLFPLFRTPQRTVNFSYRIVILWIICYHLNSFIVG